MGSVKASGCGCGSSVSSSSGSGCGCGSGEPSGGERVRYFPRQLLTADDMRTEQDYFREKQRRHNRLLHGVGIVCGLEVVADSGPNANPMTVTVCPGYALGPCGDEIYVAESYPVDLTSCSRASPPACTPAAIEAKAAAAGKPTKYLIKIRYAECPTRPMRTLPAGCGCDDSACEYSRIRDGFEIRCMPKPTNAGASSGASATTGCPPCPDDPWLVLAEVEPSNTGTKITLTNRQKLTPTIKP